MHQIFPVIYFLLPLLFFDSHPMEPHGLQFGPIVAYGRHAQPNLISFHRPFGHELKQFKKKLTVETLSYFVAAESVLSNKIACDLSPRANSTHKVLNLANP